MEKTKSLTIIGLMTALVCIGTMVIQIPMPATDGFINIGDSAIFIASILFGPTVGLIAGGVGSALADLLTGYAHWALFTLIIKGFEGFVVGYLMRNSLNKAKMILSTSVGALVMVVGYFFAGGILKGSLLISLQSVPGNIVQGVSSIIIGVPIAIAIANTKYFKSNVKQN
ncbi:Uncharacterized membrane protein [Alkalithermobacter thermoalcaliphilus JW-YL-7 = DSM 7308]|uniref:Uncharacterized membrane protein n=1 Tax=Alkalithermobacter thermoalcaliphilus JW-YL-7 = DSM 7308 TaxID=1121328 RepID=A0A150FR61_CLOPD|nr:protein of unknown function DUF1393 [[Clostridium] paradoxum JW-YL-7 = DSM 7308]SHL01688.1 Uncharacterized membrane protein [[Clostridium] paradoxum JW-YL-7 = DSM 7308]